jgi:hypothetical protein
MANRTVKVGLALEVTQFKRGRVEASQETKQLTRDVRDLNAEAGNTKKAFAESAKEVTKFSRDANGRLHDSKGRFAKAGSEAGGAFAKAAFGRFGDLWQQVPPQVKAGLIAAAAAAAPVIGATLSAGITAGIGGGAMAAGIALAARDERIKAAGKSLGEHMLSSLTFAAQPFINPVLRAIGIMRAEFDAAGADIRAIFFAASKYVEPLARGFAGLIRNALPGIVKAIQRAQPLINILSQGLPKIGTALGKMFDDISKNGDDLAMAMEFVVMFIERAIGATGKFLSGLTAAFSVVLDIVEVVGKATAFMPDWTPIGKMSNQALADVERLRGAVDASKQSSDGAAGSSFNLAEAFGLVGGEASAAAPSVSSYRQQVEEAGAANRSAFGATTDFYQALSEAKVAARDAGKGIDEHSAAGRRNRDVLEELANITAETVAEQTALTGSQGKAAEMADDGWKKFMRLADAMGVDKKEAHDLAVQLGLIPPVVDTKVKDNSPAAKARAEALRRKLLEVDGQYNAAITVTTGNAFGRIAALRAALRSLRGATVDAQVTANQWDKGRNNRWGGIYEPARNGVMRLREAGIHSTRSPARYAFAEPATGGELFVPKRGNPKRSLSLLDQGAGWYGHRIVPQQMVNRSTTTRMVNVNGGITVQANTSGRENPNQLARKIARAINLEIGRVADMEDRTG